MVPGGGLPGRLSECRDCTLPIRFVQMEDTGRPLPVNPKPDPGMTGHGTICARVTGGRLTGYVISKDRLPGPLYPYRFRPHFATCDQRDDSKSTPPTAVEEPLF
jgi:hypothetical protein